MLRVPASLAAAIESRDQTVTFRVWVDWDRDGYGGAGTLDDLTGHVASIKIDRAAQGEFPDAVALVEGEAAATMTIDLARGDTFDDRRSAAWYFSTVNQASPLYGKRRRNRPIVVDVGYVTHGRYADEHGVEWVRRFTGFTRNLIVSSADGTAELTAIDWRARMSVDVTLPALDCSVPGMTPSWIASYALWQCGIAASAPPEPGCRFWMPMHGSLTPLIGTAPSALTGVTALGSNFGVYHEQDLAVDADPTKRVRPVFGPGPVTTPGVVVPRADLQDQWWVGATGDLVDGRPITVSGSAQGRHEMWVRRRWGTEDFSQVGTLIYATVQTATTAGTYNGSFERGDTDGWTTAAATLTASTDQANEGGTYSGKLVPDGSGSTAQAIARAMTAGASMTWSVYVYSPTGYSAVSADIDWLDSSGAYVSTSIGSSVAVPAGQWTLLSITAAGPPTGFNASGKVSVRGTPTSSDVLYIDDGVISNPDGSDLVTVLRQSLAIDPDGNLAATMIALDGHSATETLTGVRILDDDQWHFVGFHWDHDAARMKLAIDGVEDEWTDLWDAYGAPPAVDEADATLQILMMCDVADYRLTACDWDTPWARDRRPGAVIDPSAIEIAALYDTDPHEAWALVGDAAASEQAVVCFTPGEVGDDPQFWYRTRRRLTSEQGQTVQQQITAQASLMDLQLTDGTDAVANRVTVSYNSVAVRETVQVYGSTEPILLHQNGSTTFTISFDRPVLSLLDTDHNLWNTQLGEPDLLTGYVRTNTKQDGSGTDTYIQVSIVSWTSMNATLVAFNPNQFAVYITVPQKIGGGNAPDGTLAMALFGTNVVEAAAQTVTQVSADSVDENGPLPLPETTGPYLQDDATALGIAAALLGDLADPSPAITNMPALGDPRRELGDRDQVVDRDGVGLDGAFWLSAISEDIGPGSYTQQLSARRASAVSTWSAYEWGEDVVWS